MTEEPKATLSAPPAGARCAIHPALDAQATCQGCGNPMCASCAEQGAVAICPACRQRTFETGPFPYTREHWSLDGLLSLCLSRFKAHYRVLMLVCGVGILATWVIAAAGILITFRLDPSHGTHLGKHGALFLQGFANVVQTLCQLGCELLAIGVSLDVLEGRPTGVDAALARLRRFPAAVLQLAVIYAGVAALAGLLYVLVRVVVSSRATAASLPLLVLGAAIVAVPAIYAGLGIMFALPELMHEPASSPLSALQRSFQIASGKRWAVFGIALLCGLIGCSGLLFCCVGVFATLPLATLLYCALFLTLKNHTPRGQSESANPYWHV